MDPATKKVSFKYVFITADPTEEIQERTFETTSKDECMGFITFMQQHFRAAGGPKSEAQRKAFKANMGEAANNVSDAVLNVAYESQMVEPVALVAQSPETGFVGVYLYCDDQAAIKQLPGNPRASSIASAAGLHMQVLGDAFLGRYKDNEAADIFQRLDFTQDELSSSAPWVAEARAQMARRSERSGETQAMLQRLKQPAPSSGSAAAAAAAAASPADAEKSKGNAAFAKGDWQRALEHYSTALSLDPSSTAARNNRAMAYLKIERFADAAEDCTAVLQAEPHNVKALLRRAAALQQLGQVQGALADLQQVLQLEPRNAGAASRAAALTKLLQPQPPAQEAAAEPQQQQQPEQPGPQACDGEEGMQEA